MNLGRRPAAGGQGLWENQICRVRSPLCLSGVPTWDLAPLPVIWDLEAVELSPLLTSSSALQTGRRDTAMGEIFLCLSACISSVTWEPSRAPDWQSARVLGSPIFPSKIKPALEK